MASCIVMPKAGVTVETCIMGEWVKKIGDSIAENDLVFTYETDKSSFEYRAVESGTLLATFVEEGEDVPVLVPVCVIGIPGEDISGLVPGTVAAPTQEAEEKEEEQNKQPAAAAPAAVRREGEVIRISPRARRMAQRMDIRDLEQILGSGPNGRIIERDVRAFAKNAPAKAAEQPVEAVEKAAGVQLDQTMAYEDKKLSNIRRVIAQNMRQSLAEMAQLTHTTSFDATSILEYRKKLKGAVNYPDLLGISVNDIIVFAVSRILMRYPELNAHFLGEEMRYFKHAHIGIAVDTPRGLMVPTIFNADQKSLKQISIEAKQLAAGCQSGNISPDKLSGASFTISNLGTFGIESFTPVINPPQTGILGVNCTIDRVRQTENGIQVYPAMGLSLTYDHRALDGAPASRFLQDLCAALEQFTVLLAQ